MLDAQDLLGIGSGSDILVVDDDETNLAAYEAALAPLGRRLVLAQSGVQALAKLLDQDFALLLLDVSMPAMGGLETARRIRQRPRNRGLPVIFITGVIASAEVILEAYELGAVDFVTKPILPEVLRAKARVYLQLQDRTRALQRESAELREAHKLLGEADRKLREGDAAAATAQRLQKLQDATAALAQATTPAEVAAVTVRLGADAVNASAACMWIVRPDGSLAMEASQGIPPQFLERWRVVPEHAALPATRVLRERRALWIESAADHAREAPETYELARAERAWAFAVLPLIRDERGIGVLSFGFGSEHAFPEDERRFLTALAHTCAQVLDRSRFYMAEETARRSAEQANRRKDEFLAMLSHELRNPLWAMVNALELIKARDLRFGREFAIIERQAEHLTHIVGDLLDFSRITRGKIQLRRDAVPLAGIVANAIESARPMIDQRAHEVVVRVADDLVVDADRHRLQQVLENLLANAVKYTDDQGRIEISAERDGAFARITVRDNGRGIPPSLLPELFEPFVQGEQALDRGEGGLGIGLALVAMLVELHGGTIEAHSDGPGTGASFALRWPAAPERPSPAADPPGARTAPVAGRRILIVDDNVDAAEMLAELMRTSGHEVALARDATTALAIAGDFAPHLALLDIGLPVIDGYELARRLRLVPECRNTLLVAISGYGQPGDRERSRAAGFAHHLVKPASWSMLEAVLVSLPDETQPRPGATR